MAVLQPPTAGLSIYFVRSMLWKDMLLSIFCNTLWKENIYFYKPYQVKNSQIQDFCSKSIAAKAYELI